METFASYQFLMLRNFHEPIERRLGAAGLAALERGVRRYGFYRGQWMRDRPATLVEGRDALSLVRNWDCADYALASAAGELGLEGTPARLTATWPRVPGAGYFAERGGGEALEPYWRNLLLGIAEGYDERLAVEWTELDREPWSVTWTFAGAPAEPAAEPLPDVFETPVKAVELIRRTTGVLAAQQMYVSRELVREFDATGEDIVRQAAYGFGSERGAAIRELHLEQGIPINLKSFASGAGLQERDPAEAIFVMRDEGHISDGTWYIDCTYCPLAEVWSSEGAEGLRLGFLFDAPNHRGLLESYHPGTVVRWHAVKSRGDATCKFRFTIPELMTADDPTPEAYDAAQSAAGRS